ncbi:protoheme IX farnesyltransferase [Paraburkholderia sp. GAS333]
MRALRLRRRKLSRKWLFRCRALRQYRAHFIYNENATGHRPSIHPDVRSDCGARSGRAAAPRGAAEKLLRDHGGGSLRWRSMNTTTLDARSGTPLSQYVALTKPRVTCLAVFCAVIGMFLATPGLVPWPVLLGGTVGIWLLSAAAFALNCLIEQKIDAKMARTARRPSARGEISRLRILTFAFVLGALGVWTLCTFTNALTMWLTLATFIGYAVIYTIFLKPATPQNIVIGGASGAMPPALGWAAVTGHVPGDAWILVLIIFVWTPPHFWALALYRRKEYAKSGLPMLPNTHGEAYTRLHILLYSIVLFPVTLLPFISGMSDVLYLVVAVSLGAVFVGYAWKLYTRYSDAFARKAFQHSIIYLALLFAALLVDHYARIRIADWLV